MIRLPLEEYERNAPDHRCDIEVDVDCDEARLVSISVDFEPGEFLYPSTTISSGGPTEVTRRLLPSEARSLAAMLIHFANEAERPA